MEEHLQQQTQRDRRPEALGDLRVLSDELICAILDSLTPRDIGRLACVSSVLYILCNEEPLWMSLCLKVSGMFEYKGSWKKTTLYRQNLSPNIAESFQKSLQFNGFDSMFLYKRWYRCFTTLEAFSVNNGDLERKKNLSLEEFYSVYDSQKPVLLTELANTWPARDSWTTYQLLLNYGDTSFRISQRSSKKITMKFKDYVSYMKLQHDEDPLYIFDDKFGEAAPSLLKDYSVPHLFREDFFDVLDNDQRPPYRWLIIGPERSGASWHVDPALTSAWNTLLSGRKRWALYPPGRVPLGVTVHVNEEDGDIHIETPSSLQWWLDFYPLLADNDKPLECTQLPGETIYVPSGWWHCVLNLETTIAVTQNFVNISNFEFVCLDMSPGHLHKGVCRAGLLAVQDGNLNKNAFDKDQLNYAEMTRKEKRLRLSKPSNKTHRYDSNESDGNWCARVHNNLQDLSFSYDIDFLSAFLEEERDHFNSIWSSSNCIGQREMREWLHRLWALKPEKRELIWKGACLALNADKWLACMVEICSSLNLPSPLDEERLPVGTGSNPVYLVADYVIKIYVEGGFESCIHCLGTELEFYSLLHRVRSPLIDHLPDILASGIVLLENGSYRTVSWDGKGVPDSIANCNLVCGNCMEDGFSFGVWSKKLFELRASTSVPCTRMWPYLVTKRCKGDIFAHLRDLLQRDDMLTLASFLGDQLHNLHILPIPSLHIGTSPEISKVGLSERIHNGLEDDGWKKSMKNAFKEHIQGLDIPPEWKLFVATIDRKRRDLSERLAQWGDPIPEFLIEKVEEYIPQDLAMLLNIFKDKDGLYKVCGSPAWIHSDIMDDNIHMEQYPHLDCFDKYVPDAMLTTNGRVIGREERQNRWYPTHILDFSDLSIGDPIYDLIPVYLDVFRGNPELLRRFLESYRLPLARRPYDGPIESWKKIERLSYRAMCFCILHDENILGAIFSLWKDLRVAKSWEEVEETVWGELNKYQCAG